MGQYPWINFGFNLNNLNFNSWIQLGECFSKCEHIAKIPLRPEISKIMHYTYLAKGVLATTAIEGNTLTEDEVRMLLDKKLTVLPSREYLKQEVDNIITLCNEIKDSIRQSKSFSITVEEICRYNKVVLNNVLREGQEYVIPGEFRKYPVVVGSYKAVDHEDIPELMQKLCDWLNSKEFEIVKNKPPIINGIIKAIIAHLYIAWIHPFGDGNGRTARILEFAILSCSGVPSPAAQLLSNHYNLTRNEYYLQLDAASKKNNVFNFLSYAIQGLRDGLVEQLGYIFIQVLQISWENFIYETFREYKHSQVTTKRRRALVLELSRHEPVPLDKLTSMSPNISEYYKDRSQMTLVRDINALMNELKLIVKEEKGYRAKIEIMFLFYPPQAQQGEASN